MRKIDASTPVVDQVRKEVLEKFGVRQVETSWHQRQSEKEIAKRFNTKTVLEKAKKDTESND